jgi:DNA-binding NarL/FixJ family response regulator
LTVNILFADNDPDFLNTRAEFLENAGYRVLKALTLADAERLPQEAYVHLAILDVSMENDDDEKDISGLALAKNPAYRAIPKIILTCFPSYEYVREALKPQLEGLPPAVDFVAKQEGPEVLLRAIRKALESRFEKTINGISEQLKEDYKDARQQTRMNYWASLGVSVTGIVIIFIGIGLALRGALTVGVVSAIGGTVAEAVSFLFFKRVDAANNRMDKHHSELLQTRRFENLLAACDELPPEQQAACKDKIIDITKEQWLSLQSQKKQSDSELHQSSNG